MWVKLDDGFPDHPKVDALSDRAFRVHIRGLCYAGRYMTDGFVPAASAKRWGTPSVRELLGGRLWHEVEGGYQINGFLEYNPSKAEVLAERERVKKQRSEAGKSRAAKAQRDDQGRYQRNSQRAAGDAVDRAVANSTQPRPVPSLVEETSSPDGDEFQGPVTNITHDQVKLLGNLHRLGPGWRRLTYGSIGRFNIQHGKARTTEALRMAAHATTDVTNGHAYLMAFFEAEEATA